VRHRALHSSQLHLNISLHHHLVRLEHVGATEGKDDDSPWLGRTEIGVT
jgi:hypothetical protein